MLPEAAMRPTSSQFSAPVAHVVIRSRLVNARACTQNAVMVEGAPTRYDSAPEVPDRLMLPHPSDQRWQNVPQRGLKRAGSNWD